MQQPEAPISWFRWWGNSHELSLLRPKALRTNWLVEEEVLLYKMQNILIHPNPTSNSQSRLLVRRRKKPLPNGELHPSVQQAAKRSSSQEQWRPQSKSRSRRHCPSGDQDTRETNIWKKNVKGRYMEWPFQWHCSRWRDSSQFLQLNSDTYNCSTSLLVKRSVEPVVPMSPTGKHLKYYGYGLKRLKPHNTPT